MKLEFLGIDKKWKYISKQWDGTVYLYSSKPTIENIGKDKNWTCYSDSSVIYGIIFNIPGDEWSDSLHKIIHRNHKVYIIKC